MNLNWLYIDINSYFATIEQQLDVSLRSKPVIVVPVLSDYSCAIAASHEAKLRGIRFCRPQVTVISPWSVELYSNTLYFFDGTTDNASDKKEENEFNNIIL